MAGEDICSILNPKYLEYFPSTHNLLTKNDKNVATNVKIPKNL